MKIVITNAAVLNTGDAAILFATIEILRQEFGDPLEITVYDQQAEAAQRYYPDLRFQAVLYDRLEPSHRKWQALRLLCAALVWRSPLRAIGRLLSPCALHDSLDDFASADLIISAGGTYLVPHYRVLPKLVDLLVARALRRPLVLFTQSLGPFLGQRRSILHFVLRSAQLILVRDTRSYRHLIDYGIRPDRIVECADAAFALAAPKSNRNDLGADDKSLRIAISVRDWPHIDDDSAAGMARYLGAVAEAVRWLIERRDIDVTFLSTCQGVAEYWTDDSAVAESVVAKLPPHLQPRARIDHDFHNPKALIDRLMTFDLVVATRMHVAILALGAGIPVLPIAYEFKTVELFKRLGLGHWVQDIGTVTGDGLISAIDAMLKGRTDMQAIQRPSIERERRSAFSAGRYVREAMGLVS